MAKWTKCSRFLTGNLLFVNIELATRVFPEDSGSRIVFAGDEEDYVDVAEKPEEIVLMPEFPDS